MTTDSKIPQRMNRPLEEVDAFVNDVNSTEVGSNTLPSKCIAAKLKAAGKKASCKLGIYSKVGLLGKDSGVPLLSPPDVDPHA